MAGSGVTVGAVWLDVLPAMKNFGSELVGQVSRTTGAAGKKAGEDLGEGTRTGFSGKVAAVAAVGASLGLAIGSAIGQAMDISSGQAKLTAQLGLTGQESERYGRIAGELYSNAYGTSLDQVNEAVAAVHNNIGKNLNDADLSQITGTVLNLAATFGVDLAGATAAVGQMMRTGLAPDARSALDVITAGFQAGVDKSGDFLDTLNEYGTQFRKLGLDGATATGLLSQGLQAGARDADVVADAIKEFSIRAVDGSKLTVEGFQAIGLNATSMAQQIAKGGPEASAALGLVLDRLRAMPDPVARSQAAVALFGTQAEDLGAALFTLDPRTAVAALGQVGGAAERMNTVLGETAQARLTSFVRTLQVGLVDFIGGAVLPTLDRLTAAGAGLFGAAWEPVKTFLGWLAGSGAVAVGVILAIVGAMKLWELGALAVSGVTKVWAAAQWLLNSALLASPITWIVIGIAALVVGIIYAWNHFEGFRAVVIACWEGIVAAARVAWSVLGAVWSELVTGAQAVGAAAMWLWSTVLSPVFNFVGLAARVLAAVVLTLLITPLVLGFQLLSTIVTWWWTTVVRPAFTGIGALATWLWTVALLPIFTAIGAGVQALGAFFVWLWQTIIVPAWNGIVLAATFAWTTFLMPLFTAIGLGVQALGQFFVWLWQTIVVPAWNGIVAAATLAWTTFLSPLFTAIGVGVQAVGQVFMWLWQTVIVPVWNGIVSAAQAAWNSAIKPVFDAIGAGVQAVGQAFQNTADWIGRAWQAIKEAAREPVQWVVNVVYNNGIRAVWNSIAGLFGLAQLPAVTMAGGGVLPGYAPGHDVVPALLSPGEGVLTPEAVRLIGPGTVLALNREASGRRPGATPGGIPGYQAGGIVGGIDAVSGFIRSLISNGAEQAVKELFAGVLGDANATPGTGSWRDALLQIPPRVINAVIEKAKAWLASLAAAFGGASGEVVAAVAAAAAPYGWHTGGQWSALGQLVSHESGWNPNAQNPTSTAYGLFQFLDSTWAGTGVGKTSDPYMQAVAGMRYISGRYGSPAGAWGFWQGHHWYDRGGMLPPGWSSVHNDTGRPEPVLTETQWRALMARGDNATLEQKINELIGAVQAQGSAPSITVQDRSGNPVETARATQLALRLAH
ncbi:phage tail tape measure protein [Pseudonocardia acaciae]|uniref:aggregation-promoting factor C-terminal-like domain-containing protein n=1 Tax=Pseudonocardia acaciae TaxID=551276 RepID=UPI0006848B7E|nr:phage tail tape measure protein [Pseudonocardia acaciae]